MNAGALSGAVIAVWLVLAAGAARHRRAVRDRLADAPAGPDRRARQVPARRSAREPTAPARPSAVPVSPPFAPAAPHRSVGARRPADGDALAEACDAITRELRSGQSLAAAITDAADATGDDFLRDVIGFARSGVPLPTAIDRAAAGHDDVDVRLVGQVLAVAAEHGGSPAEAIDRAASTLRERQALRAERDAQAASARMSTRVLTVLPVAFTGVVVAADPDVRAVLLHTPVGWMCLAVGLGLNVLGRTWARRAVTA